jgi:UDP-N-acetylmuramate--alanine ligase
MKLHFIGIGGIGVSALARYYLALGHKVSGSDLVSSEITKALEKLGAKIIINSKFKIQKSKLKCKIQNLIRKADLVIYSPAILDNHPELKLAKRLKIKSLSYPEALGELTKKYFTIAVCGSHGKSTVAAMIGLILTKAGFNPTVILGTKLKEFGDSNFRMGGLPKLNNKQRTANSEQFLVIEADEYKESFLNYWPKIIVLLNIEYDHPDYFKKPKDYILAFKKFISHLSKNGVLITNKEDKNIYNNFSAAVKKVLYYSIRQKEAKKIKKILRIPGEFNVSNALAALAVARVLKIPDKISFKALSEFQGSWRRFELVEADLRGFKRGSTRKITIISDYAHHPTQIKATLEAARERFSDKKIWVVFQPHQYQRTFYLWNDFVEVLREASVNRLIITDIYDVAGREDKKIKKKANSKKLVEEIEKENVIYIPKNKVLDYLKKNLKGGEVVIVMGAGNVYKLVDLLIDKK